MYFSVCYDFSVDWFFVWNWLLIVVCVIFNVGLVDWFYFIYVGFVRFIYWWMLYGFYYERVVMKGFDGKCLIIDFWSWIFNEMC